MADDPTTRRVTPQDQALLRRWRTAGGQGRSLVVYHRGGAEVAGLPDAGGRGIVLGRDPACEVCVPDGSLSRRHARFEVRERGDVWVVDLASTNGTLVNGKPVAEASVTPADVIELGAVAAFVRLGEVDGTAVESHEAFEAAVAAEAARAALTGRGYGVAVFRDPAGRPSEVGRWLPGLREALRPFDRVALYGGGLVEVLLPELSPAELDAHVRALTPAGLVAGCAHGQRTGVAAVVGRARQGCLGGDSTSEAQAPPASSQAPVVASDAMRALYEMADRVAGSTLAVVIAGETGTGKELVARRLHERSGRPGPMRTVNCGALPATLLESTLFGHEKGAFTGADQRRDGLFVAADGGTVFLDEVGELPPPAQAALLRVLQEGRVVRVGGVDEVPVDVRIVAATHRDLAGMVEAGTFRQDLLFRLNAVTLEVPPLRERADEVLPLARHFLGEAGPRLGEAAADAVRRHRWPGNVRELRNAMERAAVLARGDEILPGDLPDALRGGVRPTPAAAAPDSGDTLKEQVRRFEAELVLDALRANDWQRKAAAAQLGLPLRTLAHRMKVLGIKRAGYSVSEPG